ncbi:TraR/DksA family transcriptional regulator [Streptomyces sp. NPDC056949]|uniref:TraR/DksA family transcriptional regulator n=1 Tax=unclassified Streptomyces TaxID=2593676 RepID=UPI00362D6B24
MSLDTAHPDPQPGRLAAREVRRRLQHERASRLAQLTAFADAGHDPGDALVVAQKASIDRVLKDITAAVERLDQGGYGVCQVCGRPIPLERLEILPYARCCVGCQRRTA